MATKYDNIKNVTELVKDAKVSGVDLHTEALCKLQDIFGHASVGELAELANNGELQDTLFMILTHIWNWREVASFWNENANPEHKELCQKRDEVKSGEKKIAHLEEEVKKEHQMRLEAGNEASSMRRKVERLEAEVHDRDMTIMELKAKLYDMGEELARKERERENGTE